MGCCWLVGYNIFFKVKIVNEMEMEFEMQMNGDANAIKDGDWK